jgi:hypothetical protein
MLIRDMFHHWHRTEVTLGCDLCGRSIIELVFPIIRQGSLILAHGVLDRMGIVDTV